MESPRPTVTFHFWVSSLGQVWGAVNPLALASRLGPRHCGQSCARAQLALIAISPATAVIVRFMFLMVAPVLLFI